MSATEEKRRPESASSGAYAEDIDAPAQGLLGIDPVEERKAVRKLDYVLLPMMTMFYLLSFLVSLL